MRVLDRLSRAADGVALGLTDALMKAKKDYDFVPLPGQLHGPRDPAARIYANLRTLEFFERNLLK